MELVQNSMLKIDKMKNRDDFRVAGEACKRRTRKEKRKLQEDLTNEQSAQGGFGSDAGHPSADGHHRPAVAAHDCAKR